MTTMMTTMFEALVAAVRAAGSYNQNDQEPPAAILWTDGERLWEPLLPRLRATLPMLTLGEFDPEAGSGPSYWIRAELARLSGDGAAGNRVPVVYLPGVSRGSLRAVEESPRLLLPLAELQYLGVFFSHRNGKDWTPSGFLQSEDGGLGIEVATDAATRNALGRTLTRLADTPLETLRRHAPLRASFFDSLLHPDEVRNLLQWLNAPADYHAGMMPNEWESFRSLCRSKYGFDPDRDGPISAAQRLGEREGPWEIVWNRFREGAGSYRGIPELLRQARESGSFSLFYHRDSWPQENAEQEDELRAALAGLNNATRAEAVGRLADLEGEHADRRGWIWSELGQAPLANALRHLVRLCAAAGRGMAAPTPRDMAQRYVDGGWEADAAFLEAVIAVDAPADVAAVLAASRPIYRSWLDEGARALQEAIAGDAEGTYVELERLCAESGTCILFCDGLRYDLARQLAASLEKGSLETQIDWRMAALPTVTPTAKAAISPVAGELTAGAGFDPVVAGTGTRVTIEVLRRLLEQSGYQVLRGDETGDPSGIGWTEAGSIDARGHEMGLAMAQQLASELRTVGARVRALLNAGWQCVKVITDHGWLLAPGDLPKVILPEHLTDLRKGRCARLKAGAMVDVQTVPWYWDAAVQVAVAPGIASFEAGKTYEHGGISPQECVVPVLTVRRGGSISRALRMEKIGWVGLRCRVTLRGDARGVMVDLRTSPADASTSIAAAPRAANEEGNVSLVVPDDRLEGQRATVVVLSGDGSILTQAPTVVGE